MRVAGIIVQAGPLAKTYCFNSVGHEWHQVCGGDESGFLQDIFARVEDPMELTSVAGVDAMIVVNAGHVIGDNMVVAADHTVGGGTFPHSGNDCDHGLVVRGRCDHVWAGC